MRVLKTLQHWAENDHIAPFSFQYSKLFTELEPGIDDGVLILAVLMVESVQNGHICLKLDPHAIRKSFKSGFLDHYGDEEISKWINKLNSSELADSSGPKPLVIEEDRLYLHKYWVYENYIAQDLLSRSEASHVLNDSQINALSKLFKEEKGLNDEQRISVVLTMIKDLVFISGGPGTGKTYTVLKILEALRQSANGGLKVALCAPTGKASRRLVESIEKSSSLGKDIGAADHKYSIHAQTIHKMLGADRFGSNFRFNEDKQLPYDVIVVDEASMMDVGIWFNLLKAISLDTKLILLGDKDQLASVEAGSLLGDICKGSVQFSTEIALVINNWLKRPIEPGKTDGQLSDSVVYLNKTYRFTKNSGINKISESIKRGDTNGLFKALNNNELDDVKWVSDITSLIEFLIEDFGVNHHKSINNAKEYFEISKQKKILCAIRKGFSGVAQLNDAIEKRIKLTQGVSEDSVWYDGRIILSTKNDNMTGIRNGDLGICLSDEHQYYVTFESKADLKIPVHKLNSYEPAYASTIHKSQGSEFDDIAIILPEESKTSHISRELLYTAVTRARKSVLIVGAKDTISNAVENPVTRNSGLSEKLKN